jgi:DNA-binding NarL/FixJ family response regulator
MIRVLLAESQELIRFAMRTLLSAQDNIELVGEACSFQELIQLNQRLKPDIILLELHLKDEDVLPKLSEILNDGPLVLILTDCKDRETHLLALRLGARGIVNKDQSMDIILKAIRTVCAGEVWIDRFVTLDLWRNYTQTDGIKSPVGVAGNKPGFDRSKLTPRELEVARLAACGLPAKKIAAKLFISDKTVRNQLAVIYNKLGVSSQVELVFQAANLDLMTSG